MSTQSEVSMSQVPVLPEDQAVPVAGAHIRGDEFLPKDLVLYVNVQVDPDSNRVTRFLAEVYEEAQDEDVHAFTLFQCRGEGYERWKATLACVDAWLCRAIVPSIESSLAGWFLSCHADYPDATSYQLHHKVRDEGQWQNILLTELWTKVTGKDAFTIRRKEEVQLPLPLE